MFYLIDSIFIKNFHNYLTTDGQYADKSGKVSVLFGTQRYEPSGGNAAPAKFGRGSGVANG
jgi:hypothetical protein